MSGLEIDLKELELFEKRISEKRAKNPITKKTDENSEPDDLDEYLQKLTLENSIRDDTVVEQTAPDVGVEQSMPLLIYIFCGILFLLNYLQHSRRKKILREKIIFCLF